MLQVSNLHSYYGKSHILQGVSLQVPERQIVALLGRNGVGRSTTLKALMGLVPPARGSVQLDGQELAGRKPYEISRQGLAYVPENRDIFPTLTVHQNLLLGMKSINTQGVWSVDELLDFFPNLRNRAHSKGGTLSGGEQQMLTICRSLLGDPKVILIDEPTEGLAPMIVERLVELIREIRQRGVSVLLVEQKLTMAMRISDTVYVMGHGKIVYEGTPAELRDDERVRKEWLEVA
ncbi:MAG TPA: ABC transporter ATP-binding protein [bacterium]|nr:ABC transporter ATP-binding protein [bacterium]